MNIKQETIKAEFVKGLADSLAICAPAFASLTEENGAQIMSQGRGQMARTAILAGLIAHSNEMNGTAAVYLRARNVVRPSTDAQRTRWRGGGPGRGRGVSGPKDQRQGGCWQSQRNSILSPACLQ